MPGLPGVVLAQQLAATPVVPPMVAPVVAPAPASARDSASAPPAATTAAAAAAAAAPVLAIHGMVSASLFAQDRAFGFGNGQNAEWAAVSPVAGARWFAGGDVRNTRLSLGVTGPEPAPGWRVSAAAELDFFGGFNGTGAYSAEQPQPRLRTAYADIARGRTTVRIGQAFTPLFGGAPASLSHIAFPLGFGAAGVVGWRQPGVLLLQSLTAGARATSVQLQLGAFRNTWSGPGSTLDQQTAGQASAVPQLEARLDVARPTGAVTWSAYAVGHYDEKRLAGVGPDTAHAGRLAGRAVEAGGRLAAGRLTLQGNAYRGRAMGQQFAHLAQFGDIAGTGGWAQATWRLTSRLTASAFHGIDDPDDADAARAVAGQARLRNALTSYQLRYGLGPYAIGGEWLQARTAWSAAGASPRSTDGAHQLAFSVLFTF